MALWPLERPKLIIVRRRQPHDEMAVIAVEAPVKAVSLVSYQDALNYADFVEFIIRMKPGVAADILLRPRVISQDDAPDEPDHAFG